MNYLSICSGIEAATVAWHHMGWQPAGFAEIEKFPAQVLAHHYPNVRNYEDLTKHDTWGIEAGSVDLLVGGTPCQAFSTAGLRRGMDDARGQLTLEFVRLAARLRPRWIVWENVPGVLSSGGGRDFGSFLGALGELGYGWAYRVLDAQYFGVAQRRRRVFVVGYLGDWRRAAAVLLERESMRRDSAPSREARQSIAADASPSLVASGRGCARTGDSRGQDPVVAVQMSKWPAEVAPTLNAAFGTKQGLEDQHALGGAGCFVPASPIAFHNRQDPDASGGITHPLDAKDNGMAIAFDTTQVTSKANRSNPKPGDPCHPLAAGAHPPAIAGCFVPASPIAFHNRQDPDASGGITHPLGAKDNGLGVAVDVPIDLRNAKRDPDKHDAVNRQGAGVAKDGDPAHTVTAACVHGVATAMQVRRLTPVECERLQGFPDGYTDIRPRGKDTPDGPRYKALGNSMAVPVMRWIGERIDIVDKM